MAKGRQKKHVAASKWQTSFNAGYQLVHRHPLFAHLSNSLSLYMSAKHSECPNDGWVYAKSNGQLHVHPERIALPDEWAYVLAHAMLHFGFGHFVEKENPRAWACACDVYVSKFLADLKFGQAPDDLRFRSNVSVQSEHKLYERFMLDGIPPELTGYGTAGPYICDMHISAAPKEAWQKSVDWTRLFAIGLAEAAASAINVAGGLEPYLGAAKQENLISSAQLARRWFVNSYPLLGALAASFKLIEDPAICNRMDISIAAINAQAQEIYVNPSAALDEEQCKFVMAHELLHVGLRHDTRCHGRDRYLWNIACDYVINGWLFEMKVGHPPQGVCLDLELKGMSAESVYDLIVTDLRRFRKLNTLRGNTGALGDIMEGHPDWHKDLDGCTLDEFYRRCLAQGLTYHNTIGRGYLPAELVEEIRALSQPPIPWDVELAHWFDHYFPPQEKVHTYARPSRRQSSTPDIPRPRYCPGIPEDARTFAVILDTSGSMERTILAKALGAIASYSISREVPLTRLIF